MLYSQKKYPPFHQFRMKLTHYLLVPLPLLLKLPLTWCRCSDFLQGNEPIPGLYQKAGLALSGPIRKQAGRPQRQLPHRHFVAAQTALSHPTTTNKEGMVTFVIKGHKGVNTRTQSKRWSKAHSKLNTDVHSFSWNWENETTTSMLLNIICYCLFPKVPRGIAASGRKSKQESQHSDHLQLILLATRVLSPQQPLFPRNCFFPRGFSSNVELLLSIYSKAKTGSELNTYIHTHLLGSSTVEFCFTSGVFFFLY